MGIATLTSKGQLTVPIDVRHRLGLKAGDLVEFRLSADGIIVFAAVNEPIDALFGCIEYHGPALSLDQIAVGIADGALLGEEPTPVGHATTILGSAA